MYLNVYMVRSICIYTRTFSWSSSTALTPLEHRASASDMYCTVRPSKIGSTASLYHSSNIR